MTGSMLQMSVVREHIQAAGSVHMGLLHSALGCALKIARCLLDQSWPGSRVSGITAGVLGTCVTTLAQLSALLPRRLAGCASGVSCHIDVVTQPRISASIIYWL